MLIKIPETYFVTGDYFFLPKIYQISPIAQFYQFDLVDQFDKVD